MTTADWVWTTLTVFLALASVVFSILSIRLSRQTNRLAKEAEEHAERARRIARGY